ncbi:MAG: FAD-linked oxidase C-terminal domain-containing protein [Planctomycetota bacterium]|nr:FAD-linked oxidase C-terminal domain-containing protein [Planctomycetota bacterium]
MATTAQATTRTVALPVSQGPGGAQARAPGDRSPSVGAATPGVKPGMGRERGLARELANAIQGEVRFGAHDRMLYATDASLYQVAPLGVVIPASVDDAVEAARFCGERGVAMLPRGGGTSLAGQCTNEAVVIDFSPNCRRVLELDVEQGVVRVEPGITIDELNDSLASTPWFFAADPATSKHANIGGCIGNNAAGARSIRYGRTSESVLGVDACLADGTRASFSAGAALHPTRDGNASVVGRLSEGVASIVLAHASEIEARFPRTVRRNAGYGLDLMLQQLRKPWTRSALEHLNLAHLLCGSEGTLALTLGATLKLQRKPIAKGLAVLGFGSLDEAIAAVPAILETKPSAVELLDDLVIDLARANAECSRYVELMPKPEGRKLDAVLYVEYFAGEMGSELPPGQQGPGERRVGGSEAALDEVRERFEALRVAVPRVPRSHYTDAKAMLSAWKLRKSGEPLLHGIPGARKPITFVEDNAVPVENLARFVKELRSVVEAHGTRAAFYAHASVGVLHVRPLLDIHDEGDRERMRSIGVAAADLARDLGGVMSGEHGDGRVRTPLLERFYGPRLMEAMRDVKRLFDPKNLLNPGNIVDTSPDARFARPLESMTRALRVQPTDEPVRVPEVSTFFTYDDQHGFDGALEMCNGAGVCRKKTGGTMCPSYMGTLDERHSTRGRGNALRLAITGQLTALAGQLASGGEGRGTSEFGTTGDRGVSDHGGAPVVVTSDGVGDQTPASSDDRWNDPETMRTLDLCLSCKACKSECPSNVDIARLKAEYTAQRFARRGWPSLRALVFGNVRLINRLGSLVPWAANAAQASAPARWLAGRVLGIHPARTLPSFARSLKAAWRSGDARRARASDDSGGGVSGGAEPEASAPVVVLFADCFTLFNEPGIGLAARKLLEACGYRVELFSEGCCGRAQISTGLLPQAIDDVDATLSKLLAMVQRSRAIGVVACEPSCLSAIKDDWLLLKLRTPLDERQRLAQKSWLPEEFIEKRWSEHPRRPTFRQPAGGVVLHAHCHQKALWGADSSGALLRRAFPERVRVPDTGCCGMAGSFGYTRERFDLSMKIGALSVFPEVERALREKASETTRAAAICATGTSCRHQIHDGTGARAVHPVELLAELLAETGEARAT